jgi:hypothetical protein
MLQHIDVQVGIFSTTYGCGRTHSPWGAFTQPAAILAQGELRYRHTRLRLIPVPRPVTHPRRLQPRFDDGELVAAGYRRDIADAEGGGHQLAMEMHGSDNQFVA